MNISQQRRKQQELAAGLGCPRCGCCDSRVRNTVRHDGQVRRYRVCRFCHKVIRTIEKRG